MLFLVNKYSKPNAMKSNRHLIIAAILFCFCCVACNTKQQKLDAIISKYQTEDFTAFKNTSIAFKSGSDAKQAVYLLKKYNFDVIPYLVTYDFEKQAVTNINKQALQAAGVEDYLSAGQIEALIVKFINYKFPLLQVDIEGNVFINPFEANAPPLLLRSVGTGNPQTIMYEHYKDDWYLRKP